MKIKWCASAKVWNVYFMNVGRIVYVEDFVNFKDAINYITKMKVKK